MDLSLRERPGVRRLRLLRSAPRSGGPAARGEGRRADADRAARAGSPGEAGSAACGRSAAVRRPPVTMEYDVVTPGFFDTLRVPLVRGRDFSAADRKGRPPVVILDEAAAQALWPGRRGRWGSASCWADGEVCEVIGVVRRIRFTELPAEPAALLLSALRPALRAHHGAAGEDRGRSPARGGSRPRHPAQAGSETRRQGEPVRATRSRRRSPSPGSSPGCSGPSA